jgi:hypothetical protein
MNLRFCFWAVFLAFHFCAAAQKDVDRNAYYKAFQQDDLKQIDAQLKKLADLDVKEANPYIGALMMKKAGLVAGPKEKITLFKKGHGLLEAAIAQASQNVEYRFLRLAIQENAPSIIGYKSDLTKDKEMILLSFKSLPSAVKDAIVGYSKKSSILQKSDFN